VLTILEQKTSRSTRDGSSRSFCEEGQLTIWTLRGALRHNGANSHTTRLAGTPHDHHPSTCASAVSVWGFLPNAPIKYTAALRARGPVGREPRRLLPYSRSRAPWCTHGDHRDA